MKAIRKNIIYIVLLLISFSSCSTIKRNGYYQTRTYKTHKKIFSSNSHKSKKKHKKYKFQDIAVLKTKTTDFSANEKSEILIPIPLDEKISITKRNLLHLAQTTKENLVESIADDSCDLIILTNGDELLGKVTEIGIDAVKYKKCDNLEGPLISLKKSDVFMIKYPNGSKDIITSASAKEDVVSNNNQKEENSSRGFLGVILLIVGLLVLLFLSIILGALLMLIGLIVVIANM